MELQRKDLHEIRNLLAIGIGMVELTQRMVLRDGANLDIQKLKVRLDKSLDAQRKINNLFEKLRSEMSHPEER